MLYSKEQIKQIIPYDDPFLWVDEVESIEGNDIVGYKQTSPQDPYFKGHFVGFPIMPGVLVVEGIAQTGTILLREKIGEGHEQKHLLAYQVRSAFFYEPIWPGDRIKYKVTLLGIYADKIANFIGEAYVGEDKKCEVRFSVAIMDKEEFQKKAKTGPQPTDSKKEPLFSLPRLKIGNVFARIPIIQGGMAVRVSLHKLAGNVAKEGGVGIIAISGMNDPKEVKEEIRKAREIAGEKGVLGINIMGVIGRFTELLKAAVEEKIDLVIQGAGFRKDVFEIAKEKNIPVFAIASSAKVAQKAEEAGAQGVVIEGSDAGGHLGFPKGHPFRKTIDIVKEAVQSVKIPVIAAGGIFSGKDIVEMLRAGAKGVQMATRFVATEECDADEKFKQAYISAREEDIVVIHSPVGLPGRAIRTPFVDKILNNNAPKVDLRECEGCIGPVCDKSYCILKALENARKGDLENGLVFAGASAWKINKITTVKNLLKELVDEANQILAKEPIMQYV
ncbi:MAG: nitronate monooxygenase [Candidatus Paceibacterota bacterium]|jgi:NAD(P)H-dependent flavin oxidoreductase YrpB (nitropropane dioxygenase family)/3-hydroxymyristoyl/3-hydroxydecanoyl-(acyl carrier protein) dehydratase|nr:nitronate monooxygenase [Candidatus Paceibacterota bacterium]